MAIIWKNRIINGDQFFSDCPIRYRSEVIKLLRNDVILGEISIEDYVKITGMNYEG